VPEGLLPPFVEPTGPLVSDEDVVRAFARGEPAGYSAWFHVERPALLADRDVPAALRISPGTVLVRLDLPEGLEAARRSIEGVLTAEGMTLLDHDTLLGVPVALQLVGLRPSSWDLWGRDLDDAFTAMRQAAAGEFASP
jgi:hypothetical protein